MWFVLWGIRRGIKSLSCSLQTLDYDSHWIRNSYLVDLYFCMFLCSIFTFQNFPLGRGVQLSVSPLCTVRDLHCPLRTPSTVIIQLWGDKNNSFRMVRNYYFRCFFSNSQSYLFIIRVIERLEARLKKKKKKTEFCKRSLEQWVLAVPGGWDASGAGEAGLVQAVLGRELSA